MPREVTDTDGITWSCVQAYAGLSDKPENQKAAQVKGTSDSYWVVCTPNGGAQSVRIQLEGEWEKSYSDQDLLEVLKAEQSQREYNRPVSQPHRPRNSKADTRGKLAFETPT